MPDQEMSLPNCGGSALSCPTVMKTSFKVALVALGYAIGPMIIERKLRSLPSLGVVAASLGFTALAYAPFGLTQLPSTFPSPSVILAVAVASCSYGDTRRPISETSSPIALLPGGSISGGSTGASRGGHERW